MRDLAFLSVISSTSGFCAHILLFAGGHVSRPHVLQVLRRARSGGVGFLVVRPDTTFSHTRKLQKSSVRLFDLVLVGAPLVSIVENFSFFLYLLRFANYCFVKRRSP